MRKVSVVLWMVIMMVGCGGGGKGGAESYLTGPSDLHAAVLSSDNSNELPGSGIATLSFSTFPVVKIGEDFTVEVMIEDAKIFGAAYRVKFDAAHLQFIRIEEGDFLKKDGTQTVLMKSLNNGELVIGQTRLGHVLNVSGSGAIAKITFKALNTGNTDIQFSDVYLKEQFIEKGEYMLRSILFETQDTTIKIK